MAVLSKLRRLVNPGKRRTKRRKLSALQMKYFGSKRQRAAVGKRRRRKTVSRAANPPKRRRRRNVGSIVTVWPNPGRKRRRRVVKRRRRNSGKRVVIVNKGVKRMARRRRRSAVAKRRVTRRRRRSNPGVSRRRRRSYSVRRRRSNPVAHRRRRRSNPGRRRRSYGRRRNPGVMSGTLGRVAGVIGGVAVTKLLMGFVPSQFTTGVLGYIATGVVAMAQGKLVGKVSKNASLGNDFSVGGFAYLAAKMLNDFFPSIGGYTGISGMGMIGGSSFYVPQVNMPGSMGSFQVPSAVTGAIPMMAPASGSLGRLRRTGRLM